MLSQSILKLALYSLPKHTNFEKKTKNKKRKKKKQKQKKYGSHNIKLSTHNELDRS